MTGQRIVIPVDPQARSVLVFAPEISGWARLWGHGPAEDIVRVRFGVANEGASFVVREVYATMPGGVSSRSLRVLPIARLEAAANRPEYYDLLRRRISYVSNRATPWPEGLHEPGADRPWWTVEPPAHVAADRSPRLKMDIPTGYGRPDSFYALVANRFAYLTTTSARPANELAEANGVPVTTVHGWVKEARRRGFMPAGRPKRTSRLV